MNSRWIELETKSGVFIIPKDAFYVVDGLLCNIYTGSVLGTLTPVALDKIKKLMED